MSNNSTFRRWAVACLASMALVATACGSDSDSSDSTTDQDSALQGDPVVIGSICSCSGAFASSVGGHTKVVEAWVKYTNNNGGINGHPVKVKVVDDEGDATKSQRLVRELVENDKVIAIVGPSAASFDSTWADYVQDKGIPVIGGNSFTDAMATNPDFFPTGGNLPASVYGMLENAKKAGKKKLAVLACAEAPLCAGYADQLTGVADKTGIDVDVVYQSKIAASTTSFTSQCLAAKEAGADVMYVGHAGNVVQRVIADCKKQGYDPFQVQIGGDVISAWDEDSNMNGTSMVQFQLPLHDQTTEGGKTFHDALKAYAPDLPDASNFSETNMAAWAGFQLFAAAAKAGNIQPTSTGEDVKQGLYALKAETLGGLTPPLTFQPGQPTTLYCYFNEGLEDGQWTTPGGPEPVCLAPDTAELVQAGFGQQ